MGQHPVGARWRACAIGMQSGQWAGRSARSGTGNASLGRRGLYCSRKAEQQLLHFQIQFSQSVSQSLIGNQSINQSISQPEVRSDESHLFQLPKVDQLPDTDHQIRHLASHSNIHREVWRHPRLSSCQKTCFMVGTSHNPRVTIETYHAKSRRRRSLMRSVHVVRGAGAARVSIPRYRDGSCRFIEQDQTLCQV